MKRIAQNMLLAFLLLTAVVSQAWGEEKLPPKLQKLTDAAYRYYSARETEDYFEMVKKVKDATEFLGNARQTSEAIHKAIEEFVGGAEPSDDLTKMCIKMTNTQISRFATVVKTTTREENPTLSIFKEK